MSGKNIYTSLGVVKQASEFKGTSPEHRILVMLRVLSKRNYKGAFFIHQSNKFKKGIYRFKGRGKRARTGGNLKQIRMIKDLSKPTITIPKRPWLLPSTKRGANKKMTSKFWRRNSKRFTTKTR